MTTRNDTGSRMNFLPVLVGLMALCLAGAAALTLLTHNAAPRGAPTELALVVQRMPYEAQNALRGEASAFDALAKSTVRLKTLRAALLDGEARGATGPDAAAAGGNWNKINQDMRPVGEARAAGETIQASNQEARELAPKMLSERGDLASAVGVQKLEGMSRYLERFELTVQRVQQELNGMSSGVSDAAPTAQRLGDSLEFLNQVMRGLQGEESGLALTRVTGNDAEQRLKTVVQRNQQFGASVRKAIGAAESVSKAQVAVRVLPALAGGIASGIGEPASQKDTGGSYKTLILILLAAALASVGALFWVFLKS